MGSAGRLYEAVPRFFIYFVFMLEKFLAVYFVFFIAYNVKCKIVFIWLKSLRAIQDDGCGCLKKALPFI